MGRRRVMGVVVIYAEMPLPLVMGGRVWVFYCEQAIERPNERQSKQASWLVGWQVEGEWTGEGRMASKEVEGGGWKLSEAAWSAGWSGMVRSVVREGKAVVRSVVKQCRAARGLVGDGTGKPLLGARSHGILNFCLLKLKTELYFPEF